MEIQSHIPPAPNEYDQVWVEQQLNRMQQELYSLRGSGDMTFTGGLEIDGSVDFSSPVWFDDSLDVRGLLACGSDLAVAGDASFDGTVDFGNDVAFVADVSIDVSLSVGGNADIAGDISVDGTSVLQDTIISGDVTFTFDPIAGETGPIFKIFGDLSLRSPDVTYTARTDGIVFGYLVVSDPTIMSIRAETPYGTIVTFHRSQMDITTIAHVLNMTFPVKAGNTWAWRGIDTTSYDGDVVYFLPFGDNT